MARRRRPTAASSTRRASRPSPTPAPRRRLGVGPSPWARCTTTSAPSKQRLQVGDGQVDLVRPRPPAGRPRIGRRSRATTRADGRDRRPPARTPGGPRAPAAPVTTTTPEALRRGRIRMPSPYDAPVSDDGPLGEPVRGHAVPRRPRQAARPAGRDGAGTAPASSAISIATEGTSEPNVDPVERIALEQLARVADLHVADVTGLSTSVERPGRVSVVPVNRTRWVMDSLEAYRPARRAPGRRPRRRRPTTLDEADDDDPMAGMFAGMLQMLQPMVLAMTAGSMVGHLGHRSLGQYDLPIPRPSRAGADELLLVVPEHRRVRRRVEPRRATTCACGSASTRSPTTRCSACPTCGPRSTTCCSQYASGFRNDPGALEERLGEIDLADPSVAGRAAGGASAHPRWSSAPSRSPEQDALLPRLEALVAVVVGVVDHVMDVVGEQAHRQLPDAHRGAAPPPGRGGARPTASSSGCSASSSPRPPTTAARVRRRRASSGPARRACAACGPTPSQPAHARRGRRPRPLARPHRPRRRPRLTLSGGGATSATSVSRPGRPASRSAPQVGLGDLPAARSSSDVGRPGRRRTTVAVAAWRRGASVRLVVGAEVRVARRVAPVDVVGAAGGALAGQVGEQREGGGAGDDQEARPAPGWAGAAAGAARRPPRPAGSGPRTWRTSGPGWRRARRAARASRRPACRRWTRSATVAARSGRHGRPPSQRGADARPRP